jgi:hypothetical protein
MASHSVGGAVTGWSAHTLLYAWRRQNGALQRVLDESRILRGRERHHVLVYRIIRDNV